MNEIDLLTNNFSTQRLGKYLRLYAGDGNKAVAHYKANLALSLTGIHDRLLDMLGWLDIDMPQWLNGVDRFNEVCENIKNSPDRSKVK